MESRPEVFDLEFSTLPVVFSSTERVLIGAKHGVVVAAIATG